MRPVFNTPPRRPRLGVQTLLISISLVSAFGLAACRKPAGAEIARNVKGPVGSAEVPVETLVVKPQSFEDSFMAIGVIEPEDEVTLGAEIPGRINTMKLDVGADVKKGQTLIELDESSANTQIRRLEAMISRTGSALALSRKDLAREQELFNAKVGVAKAYDAAKTMVESHENELNAVKAELEAARISVNKLKIESPIDGLVAEKYSAEGEYVNPGQRLYKLITADRVDFVCSLNEKDITKVAKGDRIEVTIDALEGQVFAGKVKSVDPAGNPRTRTFRVWVTLENPAPHPIKPAMSGRARIVRGRYENVFLLPEESILREGEVSYVYLENGGKAARADVKIARGAGAKAVISDGLAANQNVVILGQYAISAGSALFIRRTHDSIPEFQFN